MEELTKSYDPKIVEDKWYKFWENHGLFKALSQSKKPPFTIVMPPPNVTGVLHMGHALVSVLQDILIRWKRMSGFEALWVPGTDHAGIATQTVVERHLKQTLGKSRHELRREEFLSHIWSWAEKSKQTILSQIKTLGCSCDWSRLAFTMDETRSQAVRYLFKRMFDQGLIYRGNYLVNWDTATGTAIADDEVEYEERAAHLYYIRYLLEDGRSIVIATVRPETLLGDTAIAVSPSDPRYEALIGLYAQVPLNGRKVPIIGDTTVDPQFGTGAVKITPAHDPNDYEMAQRHHLPLINILTPDGKINEEGGAFFGLTIDEARETIVKELQKQGLLEKTEPYRHRVGVSYRSKTVIQPYLSKQWFIKMEGFKEELIDLVKSDQVKLIPSSFQNTYFPWIQNLRDWCISRQLIWGHRIPIWYRINNPEEMICYSGEDIPQEVKKNPEQWTQDPDVLDTWFSSAIWPLSVLGWPEETEDLQKFYPTSVLITGHDILFFWVARMMVVGRYATQQPPFQDVFLHGLIFGKSYWKTNPDETILYLSSQEKSRYDQGESIPKDIQSRWEKMSKSKGNIIDPLEMIDHYGTDALRMALASSATHARQIDLDRRRFEEFKNFTNKVWNGARFVLTHVQTLDLKEGLKQDLLSLEDRWILSRLNKLIEEVNQALTDYAFDKASTATYDFFWKEFCSYYLEIIKPFLFDKEGTEKEKQNKQKILLIVLTNSIRLLHPMAPFITEELFDYLKKQFGHCICSNDSYLHETLQALQATACMVSAYPKVIQKTDINEAIEEEFNRICRLIHGIRNIRAEMQVPLNIATKVYLIASEKELRVYQKQERLVKALVRVEAMIFSENEEKLSFSSATRIDGVKVIIPLPLELSQKEKVRLLKEKEKLLSNQLTTEQQLNQPHFVEKAPSHLVEKLRNTLKQIQLSLEEIEQKLQLLQD